jgi:AcrR family transcriptional regulator
MGINSKETAAVPSETLEIATRMFAGLGYDNTTTDMIIYAGADPEAVAAVGGKPGLYRAVMERAHHDLISVLGPAISRLTPDAPGLEQMVDVYLDFSVANPRVGALWLHRALCDAVDISDLESRYVATVYDRIIKVLAGKVNPHLDLQMAIMTVEWAVYGYTRGGVLNVEGYRGEPKDEALLQRFRGYLHYLIEAMLRDVPPQSGSPDRNQ